MRFLWCAAGLLVVGCASPKMATNGATNVVSAAELPPPTRQDLSVAVGEHLIGPFDVLGVEVVGAPDLSRDVKADADGRISLPVAGDFNVVGKKPAELAGEITNALRAGYVRNPQVIVNVKETLSQTVTVDGAVKRAGIFPITSEMTMMRAIARAEGLNERARPRHVVVFRTVSGKQMAALYDLESIRLGAYADPRVYPNDVVVVDESQARQLFPQILQAVGYLLTPLLVVIR